jgi:hypothetical protein
MQLYMSTAGGAVLPSSYNYRVALQQPVFNIPASAMYGQLSTAAASLS